MKERKYNKMRERKYHIVPTYNKTIVERAKLHNWSHSWFDVALLNSEMMRACKCLLHM